MEEISIKQAVLYNSIAKYGTMIVQLGVSMVLSRLIMPEAFGVVAIISIIIGFLELLADMGLGINVIQHPEMKKQEIFELFSFSGIVGVVLVIITLLLSYPLTVFLSDKIFLTLCPLVSIVSLFNSLNVVPNAILLRDKKFKIIAKRAICCALTSGTIAVILAYAGAGVYALISQVIINSLFFFLWNYILNPLKLISFSFKKVTSLLGTYSLFQILFNFLNYFTRNLDHLLIGKFFGTANLAQYNKSYALYLYPNNIFASVLTGVLHPFIREYKDNFEKMFEKYVQIEKLLSVIGLFTMISFFFCSKEIVLIMFGDNWEPAGVYLRCLSICMWTQMMCSVAGSIFLGLERTDQTFKCGIFCFFVLVLSITIGVMFNNLMLLSLCVGISYNIIFLFTNYILIVKTMHISLWKFFSKLYLDGLFGFLFIFIIILLNPVNISNIYLALFVKLVICLIYYFGYLFFSKQIHLLNNIKTMILRK